MPGAVTSPAVGRVLMTTDAVGGVFTYAIDLARGLAEGGVHTTLAVLGPTLTPDQKAQALGVPGLKVEITGIALDWLAEEPSLITAAGEALAKLALREGADVVHLNSPILAAGGAFSLPVVGACHSCLASWWKAVRSGPMPADFRWRTQMLARGYKACDVLIAPSAAFASATARLYGIAPPRVVHNGRRPMSVLHQGPRERCVVTGGRLWDRGKNVRRLDAAAALLDAPILAAGPLQSHGGERITLKHIRSLGRLSEPMMGAALARSRVFASLALYEPFGLTVLEAAQAGCALVLSDIPTFRELWDGVAVFVPPADEEAAAAAMQALLDDPAEAARAGMAARARAARYSPAGMTAGVLAAYEAALGETEEAVA
jgi:glycogen synthase